MAYEDEVHQGTHHFWRDLPRNKKHQLGKHPIFTLYGDKLSRGAYEHTSDRARKVQAPVVRDQDSMRQLIGVFHQIMQLEGRHTKQLISIAIDIVSKVWGFPKDRLRAMITPNVDINSSDLDKEEEMPDNPELLPEVNKRLTLNAMSHGSAIHNMMQLHHLVDRELKALNPNLIGLYDKIASGSHGFYWFVDIEAMMGALAQAAVGSAKAEWKPDNDQPIVIAKAVCFPILVQELCKGIMMILNAHGLTGKDEATTRYIYSRADSINHEPWLIQVGPELWRRFLKVVNDNKLPVSKVVAAIARKPPDEVHRIVASILDNKAEAGEMLKELIEAPKSDAVEFDDSEEYGDDFESEDSDDESWRGEDDPDAQPA